ncbi:MAG: IPT/TIG domain-containing protein [Solirubrobacteraceae bacterium]
MSGKRTKPRGAVFRLAVPAALTVLLVSLAVTSAASAALPAGLAEAQLETLPAVTNVVPFTGPVSGGTLVTIEGTNLAGATAVDFGGTSATFTQKPDERIEAVAPPGAEGTVDVTVTTAAGTSPTSSRDHFSYVPPGPTVLEVSPNEGSANGGKVIKVFGAHLEGTTEVHFGSTPASFEKASAETLTVTTPEGVAPVEDIRVTTPEGTSPVSVGDRFFYTTKIAEIEEVSPNRGPAAGGTTVGIAGSEFHGVTGVEFGGKPALSFTANSSGSVTAVAPPDTAEQTTIQVESTFGPSSPEWCVKRGNGGASCAVKDNYKYLEPTVTAVTPDKGPLAGGTPVTLTGTGFGLASGETEVLVGKTPATAVECTSITSCTAVIPAATKAKPQAIKVLIKSDEPTKSKTNKEVEFSYE